MNVQLIRTPELALCQLLILHIYAKWPFKITDKHIMVTYKRPQNINLSTISAKIDHWSLIILSLSASVVSPHLIFVTFIGLSQFTFFLHMQK